MKKVYLAGKISENDWRHEVVAELRGAVFGDDVRIDGNHAYVGPFFEAFKHDCLHGWYVEGDEERQAEVKKAALAGIASADIVFAWLDDETAFGTIFEIGYASALGKRIIVGVPEGGASPDLWFVHTGLRVLAAATPADAFRAAIAEPHGATFIELAFWRAFQAAAPTVTLTFQRPILRYYVDFAHEPSRTVIELDGMIGHSSPTDIEKDRRRQREIENEGWRFIRFGGREVTQDAAACAAAVLRRILDEAP